MVHIEQRSGSAAVLSILFLILAGYVPASAGDNVLGQPHTVMLSPEGGRLFIEEKARVVVKDGTNFFSFVIPDGADGLRIEIPGHQTAHWTSTLLQRESDSEMSRTRQALLEEKENLAGRLEAARARKSLWKHLSEQSISFDDMEKRDKNMVEIIAALTSEELRTQRRLAELEKLLALFPAESSFLRRVDVTLRKSTPSLSSNFSGDGTQTLTVRYSYTLANCGWRPVYTFDAVSEKDEITVRLLAEIRQYSGMDWRDVKLILASHSSTSREPSPLPRWEVGENIPPAGGQQAFMARQMAMEQTLPEPTKQETMLLSQKSAGEAIQPNALGAYVSWSLEAHALPEGISRLNMDEDVWKTPLQWLARPLRSDSRVWLTAEYTLRPDKTWPQGYAEYNVDGQYIGQGMFKPQGDSTRLFFGVDPRVSVHITSDDKKRGESGFIDKNRTWFWSWIFTLHNEHSRPVNVRLERPEPMIVEQAIEVKYQNSPTPKKDEKSHALVWDVTVPAKGKSDISHAISITAPKDMPLSPVAP